MATRTHLVVTSVGERGAQCFAQQLRLGSVLALRCISGLGIIPDLFHWCIMTRKYYLAIAVLSLALACAGFATAQMQPARPGIAKANFDQIKKGMTKAAVEEILVRVSQISARISSGLDDKIASEDERAARKFGGQNRDARRQPVRLRSSITRASQDLSWVFFSGSVVIFDS